MEAFGIKSTFFTSMMLTELRKLGSFPFFDSTIAIVRVNVRSISNCANLLAPSCHCSQKSTVDDKFSSKLLTDLYQGACL